MRHKKYLGIDPSIINCGYCLMTENYRIKKYGLLQSKEKTWLAKYHVILNQVSELIHSILPDELVLEYPEYWEGTQGHSARESGSLFKLTFLCGGIVATARDISKVTLVTPSNWKGQLKKDKVRKRLMKVFPKIVDDDLDHNIMDAVGIIYYTLKERENE